ncbi:hypothetical protein [Kordia sp.]|uniref:hypothetical protein n=1 Tax=Kordia sp. TaxID=1965332 RepID=UPI003D27F4F3
MKSFIFILLFSLFSVNAQDFGFSKLTLKKLEYYSVSKGITYEGKDSVLNYLMAFHVKKCYDDSKILQKFIKEIDSSYRKKKISKIKLNPYYKTNSIPLVEGTGILGQININILDLRLFPDLPILLSNNFNANKRDKVSLMYKEEKTPVWGTTICAFIGHELKEQYLNLLKKGENRSVHHCIEANKFEDLIMYKTNGVKRSRGFECSAQHKGHTDLIIEIKKHGYIIMHLSTKQANFNYRGKVDTFDESLRITYIEYLGEKEYLFRKYHLDGCDCIKNN